jgi:hypothetical protein
MRTREELRAVRALAADRLDVATIARRTGVPRTTVFRWLSGGAPRFDDPDAATCPRCGHADHALIDERAYCHLLGLYLGDGHLATFPRTYCLRIYLDRGYPGIVASCVDSMRRVAPRNRVAVHGKAGCAIVQCYSRAWPCLLPQHGPGHKHERRIELADWQRRLTGSHPEALIRGLIESDGSRHQNRVLRRGRRYSYARYTFSNRSADIRGIFTGHLDLLGIPWRPDGPVNISVARREGVAALDAFVGPKS